MNSGSRIQYLVIRYLYGDCDTAEQKELYNWVNETNDHKILLQELVDLKEIIEGYITLKNQNKEEAKRFWIEKVEEFTKKYNKDRYVHQSA